jgi:polyhydroxyalkanoate synthase
MERNEMTVQQANVETSMAMQAATAPPVPETVDDYVRACADWWLTLAGRPEQQLALARDTLAAAVDTWRFAAAAAAHALVHGPVPEAATEIARQSTERADHHADNAWMAWPFNVYANAHAHFKRWSQHALAAAADGLEPANAQRLEFLRRLGVEAASPAHYLLTNPELLGQTAREGGANLLRGAQLWLEDLARLLGGGAAPGTEKFRVGVDVAATPGRVVLRNELIELIQYSPRGTSVHAEPVLVTPAWIMKYYVLDLSPHNSLVNYLVEQGHTVFMISWKNPTAADRNLGMDDYLRLGLGAALDAVSAIVPDRRIHGVGYCIGGTLLSIGAARMAQAGDERFASITLLAAQTDFSAAGELAVFISPNQLAALGLQMQRDGVLRSESMAAAFALLRPAELVWAPIVNQYLRGQRAPLNDLMAWNADGTRMPCRMHGEYLSRLYLENELSTGRFTTAGERVDLAAITAPLFVVGTETDHVAPWPSVYKTGPLTSSRDYTFLLTSGGHNAGIVSGPVNPKRRHSLRYWHDATAAGTAADFQAGAGQRGGSWWPTWQQWLAAHSSAERVAAPSLGNEDAGYPAGADAPGEYVHG